MAVWPVSVGRTVLAGDWPKIVPDVELEDTVADPMALVSVSLTSTYLPTSPTAKV